MASLAGVFTAAVLGAVGITWELVGNADSQAPPKPAESDLLSGEAQRSVCYTHTRLPLPHLPPLVAMRRSDLFLSH